MRTDHIGADEIIRSQDRAIDMRFRRKVHQRIDAELLDQIAHGALVADVAAHEHVARIALQACEIFKVPRVGQGIEYHDAPLACAFEPMADEVRADEAGAPGDADVSGVEAHPTSFLGYGAN